MTGSAAILFSPPLTARSIQLLRKVVFTFKSRDQGWSSYYADHGTYENTWTWFDAMVGFRTMGEGPESDSRRNREGALEENTPEEANNDQDNGSDSNSDRDDRPNPNQEDRPSPPRLQPQWNATAKQRLQDNRHAGRVAESYRIELEAGQGILAELKEGWEIALWASAQFPGWVNNVEEASMELWEVDSF